MVTLPKLVGPTIVLALVGCDGVWGLSGEPTPCDLGTFDAVEPRIVGAADGFSVADGVVAVVFDGVAYEQPFVDVIGDGDLSPIPLGLFPVSRVGIAPEGDVLFYAAGAAPTIRIATLEAGAWQPASRPAPPGRDVGTPSSAAFGPHRVFVRQLDPETTVQEYVMDGKEWTPVGDPLPLEVAPSLSSSGRTMVFAGVDEGVSTVFAANRASVDASFEAPRPILRAQGSELRVPQFLGAHCDALFVSSDGELRRYDR